MTGRDRLRIGRRGLLAAAAAGAATLAPGFAARPARAEAGFERLLRKFPPAPLPEFGFLDAAGTRRTLADVPAAGWVINLWGSWCAPCREEMPALDRMAAALAPERIVVLPLAWEFGPTPAENVARFYRAHGIAHLGVWLDPRGAAGRALVAGADGRGEAPRYPTTLVVTGAKREAGRLVGAARWDTAEALALVRELVRAA